jgi:hypothetical protein
MLELIDIRPDLSVQESEYQRLLGYPGGHVLEGRSRELADWAKQWYVEHGRPWIYARRIDGLELNGGRHELRIQRTGFMSKPLHDQLTTAQAHEAMLVAVSAGSECETKARELWQQGKPDEYFFLEIYGSAVVEHLIAVASGRICGWAEQNDLAVLPHYSPGYSGWDISDQIKLWELIRQNRRQDLPGELEVLDTGMLNPKKSLLALFGVTRHLDKVRNLSRLVPCENCLLANCQYRRAPYQHSLPQLEDVRRLRAQAPESSVDTNGHGSTLDHGARYSINVRALQKWSQERLQLKFLPDDSVEAQFRYEGTTCSNLGQPLEFIYRIKLGSAEDRYRIVDAHCAPAPDDTGHASQCEYLNNSEALMRSIAGEKPLLGKPLNDVFAWSRPYNPSGCFCDADRRAHKWGLVLEVIHYALVEHQKKSAHRRSPASAGKFSFNLL